jgi:hypothetical protein
VFRGERRASPRSTIRLAIESEAAPSWSVAGASWATEVCSTDEIGLYVYSLPAISDVGEVAPCAMNFNRINRGPRIPR